MLSLYRTLSLRYLERRWFLAAPVVLSIALGVATLVATRALNQSMASATRTIATPLSGIAELFVNNGDSGVPRDLAESVSNVTGVRAAEPFVVGRVRMPDLGEHQHCQLLGIVWKPDSIENNPWGVSIEWTIAPAAIPGIKGSDPQAVLAKLKEFRSLALKAAKSFLTDQQLLAKLQEFRLQPVLLGKQLAEKLQPAPLDPKISTALKTMARSVSKEWAELIAVLERSLVRIQPVGEEPQIFIQVGTVQAEGLPGTLVNHGLIMNAWDAAELLGQPDLVTRIDLFLKEGADREDVRRRVSTVLGSRATVRTPGENDQRIQEMMAGLQLGFSLSGAGALVIGLFLVYMIMTVSVADRRHEIGILRSVGATRAQVWALFVGEAGFLGIVGAGLGIPAGLILANLLGLGPIERLVSELFVPLQETKLEITAETILVAAGAGILTALLAALIPAVRAAQEEPASAVRRMPPVTGVGHWVALGAASLALFVSGSVGMVFRKDLPDRWGTYGGFITVLLGTMLTTPLLAALVAHVLQPAARCLLGIEGRLAADNLVRAPARTGLVITVLAAGVALFMQTAGVIRSNKDPIMEWVDEIIDSDLVVTSGSQYTGTGQNLLLPEELGRLLSEMSQVEAALPVRFRQVEFDENRVFLVALAADRFYEANRRLGTGTSRDLFPRLSEPGPAKAIVSENFAALYGIKEGNQISLRGPRGSIQLQVIGAAVDYNFPRGTVIVDLDIYRQHFDDAYVDEYYVYLKPRADAQAVREELLRRWQSKYALTVATRGEVHERFEHMIQRFADVAYAQEIVVGMVAALGVMFSLVVSVMQRRRELGVLRAVGATQGQVLVSVLAEAILMGLIGTVIGLLIGVPVEWYCVHVILFEEAGFLFPVRIPWQEAGFIGLAAIVTATIAGLGPAFRTSRQRIPEAIAYE
jgi:putative ABC transport system permease protein